MNILKLFSLFILLLTSSAYSQATIKHTVTKGESISAISKKYNVKESEIYELNPQTKGKYLQLNATLLIPNKNFEDTTPKTHTVASGETLSIIAQKYNLKLAKLMELNPTVDSRRLKIGTVLQISSSEKNEEFANILTTHKVVSGETLGGIAQKYNIGLSKLRSLNPEIDPKYLKVGTVLKLIEEKNINEKTISIVNNQETEIATNSEEFQLKTHKIKKGETLKIIAKKYQLTLNQLKALNPKLEPRKLKIGTVVVLNKLDSLSINKAKKDSSYTVFVDETKDLLHKVLINETKYSIAKKYGITVEKIDELNPEVINSLPENYLLIIKKGTINEGLTPEIINKIKYDEITSVKIEILIEEASKKIGTPYRSGGTSGKGFDCSGLMYTTFKEINMDLPRSSKGMAKYGIKINKSDAKKGDLIFFTTNRKGSISHVGLITEVLDDEIKFIHSSTSLGVIISSIKEPYYAKRFVQINRIL